MKTSASLQIALGQFVHRHHRLEQFLDRLLRPTERAAKGIVFGCRMCGQCILHSTGMVCPMTCPKNLRNGPCGGVRLSGQCEISPHMPCVWVTAYVNSKRLPWRSEFYDLQPPVDWSLQGSSSWVNALTGRDQIASGCVTEPRSGLEIIHSHDH